jgi:hypothetical protein
VQPLALLRINPYVLFVAWRPHRDNEGVT